MKLGKVTFLAAVAALGLVGMSSGARADSIDPVGADILSEAGPLAGPYTYSIELQITSSNEVKSGDYAVLGDGLGDYAFGLKTLGEVTGLNGVASVSLNSSDWAITEPAGKDYVVFTFTGTTPLAGPQSLGVFSFESTTNLSGKSISGAAQYTDSGGNSQPNAIGPLLVVANLGSAVPVPAAAWTGLSTLIGLSAVGLFQKRRRAVSFA